MFPNNDLYTETRLGITINTRRCPSKKGFYPDITPSIESISPDTSESNIYTTVQIYGLNFLPFGNTELNMGQYKNLPYSYLNSTNISFQVPSGILPGIYDIQLNNTNNYNVPPNSLYSNIVKYTIT